MSSSNEMEVLERNVIRIRKNISNILDELDRRRQAFFALREQVSTHKTEVMLAGAAIAFLMGAKLLGRNSRR